MLRNGNVVASNLKNATSYQDNGGAASSVYQVQAVLNGEVIDGRRVVVKEFVFLVELPALGGRKMLEKVAPVRSLMSLEGVE